VVDWRGQIITMSDRAYLTDDVPMCIIWGEHDQVIPVSHADAAAVLAPHARVVRLPNTGHFPHRDYPDRFVKVLNDFIRGTAPARFDPEQWRGHLRRGGDVRIRQAEAGHAPVVPVPRRPRAS
jgi:hypothetical protein